MNTAEFFSQLHSLDIRLTAVGERLRISAPKGTLTASLRQQILQRKAEILQFLQNASAVSRFAPPPIRPLSREQPMPLSFAQERLWFLEQLEPESSVYNVCRAARIRGALSVKVLESSLTEVMRRHEALRTSFQLVDGRAFQVMRPAQKLSISLIELSSLSERDSETSLLIREEARRPFDLSKGPFLRATLLRRSDDDHVLIITTHHIVSDAWSMGILTRELWMLYETYANESPSTFPELPLQYADYAVWQREWLQGEVLESQLAYWKKQLENIPIVNLPTDRLRPAKQSFCGAREPIALSESLTGAINELSRREGVTQFMTLLAAFNVLLYRYSGQEDLVVGSPIANRNRTELEGLIGFFVNTVVLRADLSGNPTFKELLVRVRDVCFKAYRFQHLPFEKLVKELQPERDQSRNPLFQVMFVLQNATRPFTGIPGLRIEPLEVATTRSPFDLSLFLRERDGKYLGNIEYSSDLFDDDRIERMACHFQTLLEAIVTDPDQSIARLPILTEAERHRILVEWNDTAADYPKDKCIHQLFEEQVERTPEAIAVEFENQQITYQELNQRANQLAHYLMTLGVGPEKLVGICVERSIVMVVGLLGILKAGGVYVPLDPNYPKQRLQFMVEDSHVCVLLHQRHLLANLPQTSAVGVCLEELIVLNGMAATNPKIEVTPDTAAYVIYTSGSTGTPKASIGLHRGAVNRFSWMWRAFPFNACEVSCIKTSLSFVDSIWELFGPLLQGVPSVIIPEQVVRDSRLLVQALAKYRITRIVLVPSLLRAILETSTNLQKKLPKLKLWSTSGEPLQTETTERFRKLLPQSTLVNLYGASEVSADVTFAIASNPVSPNNSSIGHPISNTQIYLLDSLLQPVPIGVPGEVYVGGKGLARGYLNRPELTSERFIPSPFNNEEGSRLYRTSDLARYLPDGNIEFLGRTDNQVKIRGYRIEPAEVETVLNQHPAVYESVIIAGDDGEPQHKSPNSSKRLIAYIVTSARNLSCDELRNFLMRRLPDYMVPSVFITLDQLSLTPNGKVNRQALPPPEAATQSPGQSLIEPRTEFETLVAKVWRDVLKTERLGIHDNFFDLGGALVARHSGRCSIVRCVLQANSTPHPF